jgi:putative peptidoglycan lipid II flippase
VGLYVLAEPIVSVTLGHGEFGPEGVRRTANALRFLALSIVPAGATGLVARCYYALDDFATPVRVSVAVLLANVALNVLFLVGLEMDVEGLALSAAITSWANLLVLWPGLVRRLGLPRAKPGGPGAVVRTCAAAAACGVAARGTLAALGDADSAMHLCLAILAGTAAFAGAAHLSGLSTWRELLARMRRAGGSQDDATGGRR